MSLSKALAWIVFTIALVAAGHRSVQLRMSFETPHAGVSTPAKAPAADDKCSILAASA